MNISLGNNSIKKTSTKLNYSLLFFNKKNKKNELTNIFLFFRALPLSKNTTNVLEYLHT